MGKSSTPQNSGKEKKEKKGDSKGTPPGTGPTTSTGSKSTTALKTDQDHHETERKTG